MACTKGINKHSRCVKKILRYVSIPCLMFKVSRFNYRCNLANNIGMGGKLDKLERKKEYCSVVCTGEGIQCGVLSYCYKGGILCKRKSVSKYMRKYISIRYVHVPRLRAFRL